MLCLRQVLLILASLVFAGFAPCANAHEDGDEVAHWVKVEVDPDKKSPELSKKFRSMVADFVKAGGQGRVVVVHSDVKRVAGAYFAVDRWPTSAMSTGTSVFTRDSGVLNSLKEMQKSGVPIFLQSTEQRFDAQVFSDDELGRPLRETAFPNSKKKFSISVSPSLTRDILIHEQDHIAHKSPDHSYSKFLAAIEPQVNEKAYRAIRRGLTEVLAYQKQYLEIEKQKKAGTSSILVLDSVTDKPARVDFETYRDGRLREMKAAIGMYTQMIAAQIRKMPASAKCKTIDQVRDALVGMGPIETDFLENDFDFNRCDDPTSSSGSGATVK